MMNSDFGALVAIGLVLAALLVGAFGLLYFLTWVEFAAAEEGR